ncbi:MULTISPECIES: hypothetical protein [Lysobacter]|uniref:hypothetical protein n=1 Tax=Lysobacter TaxID=68 RepID=UPI001F3B2B93|nr:MULTISPECIES: hypothetical protein [Lysobacter]UJB18781.1 hypothetical protein L1A79_21080 [Lysobacter capsici]UJQ27494.1 hypothetical protein L2D09_18805 [Lysobacter gummosus]
MANRFFRDPIDALAAAGIVPALLITVALLVTARVYRNLRWRDFLETATDAARTTGMILRAGAGAGLCRNGRCEPAWRAKIPQRSPGSIAHAAQEN